MIEIKLILCPRCASGVGRLVYRSWSGSATHFAVVCFSCGHQTKSARDKQRAVALFYDNAPYGLRPTEIPNVEKSQETPKKEQHGTST